MDFEDSQMSAVKYGVLWERVQTLDKKIDKLENNIEKLLAIANKSKGGLWFGITLISGLSAMISIIISYIKN